MFETARYHLLVPLSFFLAVLSVGTMNVRSATVSGHDVRGMQQTLLDVGYWPGPIDGVLGSQTRSAIRQYQRDENLPITGRLDAETSQKVEEARRTRDSDLMKLPGMDANDDGAITRQEYRGNDRSFANHDWNGDGVLSSDEIRPGAHKPARRAEGESAGGEFKNAGKEMKRGSAEAGHEMKKGKPIASGMEFGKGAGQFGEKVGKGVKKAASTESDRGNREKQP